MKKVNFLFIAALLISLTSCSKMYDMNQPKDPVVEHSVVWPLSGEWYVTYQFENPDGTSGVGDWDEVGYTTITTYNTSDESSSKFWIADYDNFWNYKVKSDCNVGSKSFSSADSLGNQVTTNPLKINIKNGKVIEDGGKSPSGVISDSIYFEIEYLNTTFHYNTPFVNGLIAKGTNYLTKENGNLYVTQP